MVWCGQWKVRGQTESRRNPRTSSQVAAAVSGDGDMSRGWQAPSLKAKSDDRLAKEFEKRTDHYKQDETTSGDFAIYFSSPSLLSEENNSLKELVPRSIFLSGLLFLAVWFIVVGRERIPNPETLLFILGLRLTWAVGVERWSVLTTDDWKDWPLVSRNRWLTTSRRWVQLRTSLAFLYTVCPRTVIIVIVILFLC